MCVQSLHHVMLLQKVLWVSESCEDTTLFWCSSVAYLPHSFFSEMLTSSFELGIMPGVLYERKYKE